MKFQLAVNMERIDDSLDMQDVARHTLEMVQIAEDSGFDIVWAAEHHALEMTIAPNPFQLLTWWAAETSRIRLGTAVATAAYWHPINLAGEAAFTDLITGGRLEFGIGSGAYQREFDRMKPGLSQSDGWRYMRKCCLPCVSYGKATTLMMENSGSFQRLLRFPSHFKKKFLFGFLLARRSHMIMLCASDVM